MSESAERLRVGRLRFRQDAEAGLTLVELLVVLLIIGILLAIVIPPRLSPTRTAHKVAHANLLYTNGHQSRLGVCSPKTVSTITAVDEGLTLLGRAPSTRANTTSTSFVRATKGLGSQVLSPRATRCGITVVQQASHPTGTSVSSERRLPSGLCHGVNGHTTIRRCNAANALAGTGHSSVQST